MTTIIRKLSSEIDQSLNFVFPSRSGSYFEARLVLRDGHKAVVYISSQDGCSQGCRMCYLTSLRQKKMTNAVLEDILIQAETVISALQELNITVKNLHFNFMARGDVVSNVDLVRSWNDVELGLSSLAQRKNISANAAILVSTIFPRKIGFEYIENLLKSKITNIYYSYYSKKDSFRRRWLPNSQSVEESCIFLKKFHEASGKRPRFHFCFINGQNDSTEDLDDLIDVASDFSPFFDVNIVRFNPPPGSNYTESPEERVLENVEYLRKYLPNSNVKIISRVGYDVKASCGMFLEDVNV